MAVYMIQETVDFTEVRRPASDDEICARFPHHLVFSANRDSVYADGTTPVVIQMQLVSLPLSDDSRRPIQRSITLTLIADDEQIPVTLDENGHAVIECAFAAAGDYVFTTDGVVYSDGITIKAVRS